ncbi:MAG TPA: alpha/beta hydrolase [Gemmatimonadaceae bacterium]|jgi:pimeloyl-ACP methyl ester carboxylesterase|nr:alpha/beta hydrolase [Gemmatimonadaceae bacterium]
MITLLLLALAVDSTPAQRRIPLTPPETLTVTVAMPGATAPESASRGTPVVLLPGIIGSSFGYRHVVPLLAASGHPTFVVEPLGVGTSSHPADGDYALDTQADRVGAVLDSLGVHQAIVIGSNFGAAVALRLAYRRPDCVVAVLLLDGGPVDRSYTEGVSAAMKFAPVLRFFGARGIVKHKVHDALAEASADPSWVTPDVTNAYARPIIADLGAAIRVMQAMRRAPVAVPLRDNLWRIAQPVRLLIGASNRRGGIGADELSLLSAQLPDFASDSVFGSGSYLQEERPDAVVAATLALDDAVRVGRNTARVAQTPP